MSALAPFPGEGPRPAARRWAGPLLGGLLAFSASTGRPASGADALPGPDSPQDLLRGLEERVERAEALLSLVEGVHAQVLRDPDLGLRAVDTYVASPYVLCCAVPPRLLEPAWKAELAAFRDLARRSVTEHASVLRQVHAEFFRRFSKACDLAPLMSPFGGRPDLPTGKRSYRDGYPLVVVIAPPEARPRGDAWPATPDCLLHGGSGWLLVCPPTDGRAFPAGPLLRAAVAQLLDAFSRQTNEWGRRARWGSFVYYGLAGYFAGATPRPDGTLRFDGRNADLAAAHAGRAARWSEGQAFAGPAVPVFSVRDLALADGWGWSVPGTSALRAKYDADPAAALGVFSIESWALVRFLLDAEDGARRSLFERRLRDLLEPPTDATVPARQDRLAEVMGIRSPADWEALDRAFRAFFGDRIAAEKDVPAAEPPAPPETDLLVPVVRAGG